MINGLPGNMASLVEAALANHPQFKVIATSLTGPRKVTQRYNGKTGFKTLFAPPQHYSVIQETAKEWPDLIAIDFTQPNGVEENVNLYCSNNIPFIMGTTGGNRDILPSLVQNSNISAVIATNMSAPVVMLINMFIFAAENCPNTLKNWEIQIVESHQAKKEDVSGTALTIGEIMKGLGVKFIGAENIRKIRTELEQILTGIPKDALGGHGWHKYQLLSPDRNVMLGF